jgi:hypothetical protein
MALKIPYVYDYITKLCREQPEVIQNQSKSNVRAIGKEAVHRKHKRRKFGGSQAYACRIALVK